MPRGTTALLLAAAAWGLARAQCGDSPDGGLAVLDDGNASVLQVCPPSGGHTAVSGALHADALWANGVDVGAALAQVRTPPLSLSFSILLYLHLHFLLFLSLSFLLFAFLRVGALQRTNLCSHDARAA